MHREPEAGRTSGEFLQKATVYAGAAVFTVTLGLAAAASLGAMLRPDSVRSPLKAAASAAAWDASRFLLNALLVPALDGEAIPLRFVDPRAALHCGPNTAVLVNREPLLTGALVPDTPFELDWLADGCRPFGANGPRLDGRIRMTVYREDWGFSAMVEPTGFRVTSAQGQATLARSCAASLPQDATVDDPTLLTAVDANQSIPCR